MGTRISAVAFLSAASTHDCRRMADDHQSFRVGTGVIRGTLLSADASTAGVHLYRCAVIWTRTDRGRIRLTAYPWCQRSGRPQPLRPLLRRIRSPRLRPIHATDVLQPADAGPGTREPLTQYWPAKNPFSLHGCCHGALPRRLRLRSNSFDSYHCTGRAARLPLAANRPRRIDTDSYLYLNRVVCHCDAAGRRLG